MTPDHDVAIVGMGPVGATLANLLALRGLSVLVIERDATIHGLPRAVQFDDECMRVFQTIGASAALEPEIRPVPGMRFVDQAGRLILDWARPMAVGPQGWVPSYRFHQPQLEHCLRDQLKRAPKVETRLRYDVFAVESAQDHVALRLEDLSSGQLRRTTARYVVGCDGARSTVRRFMGSELLDLKSHERWLVLDVILNTERPDLGDYSVQYCDAERPSTYVRGIGKRRRWEIMLRPGEDPAAASQPEAAWALLSRWLKPEEARLERSAIYTFHSVVAEGWRAGRLLIAGDAAHQTPPFMGQGMCAGIRDAANLAWKLADVVQGLGDDALLDTYESERSPHAQVFINEAVRLGSIIRALNDRVTGGADGGEPDRFVTPQPRLGPGAYDDREPGGRIAEQPLVREGVRLDDLVGYRSVLLAREQPRALPNTDTDDLMVMVAPPGPCLDWLDRLDGFAVLIRPDRYIFGVARSSHDCAGLIDRYRTARWRRAPADRPLGAKQ